MAKQVRPGIQGRPGDARIVHAVVELLDQFSICDLAGPVTITVRPGEMSRLRDIMRGSEHLLMMDVNNQKQGNFTIWGVEIKEVGT